MIDKAEDLDIVMPIYNLLEYTQNYSMISRTLWNYYKDEIDKINDNTVDSKLFKYTTRLIVKTPGRPEQRGNREDVVQTPQLAVWTLNVEVSIPLKYLRNQEIS